MAAANNRLSGWRDNKTAAHVLPLVVFMLFLPLTGIFKIENAALPWHTQAPEHWVYPLQSVVCLLVLAFFWRNYEFRPIRGAGLAIAMALLGIAIWIVPSVLYHRLGVAEWPQEPVIRIPLLDPQGSPVWRYLGLADRPEGFDPTIFEGQPLAFGLVVVLRFFRMVVVVALVEEIFWRGFLMRWISDPDRPFEKVAFGTHTWKAFWITTASFMIVHAPEDWLGAFVYGALTYWVAVRTKSLFACVLMHAVANFTLGVYVMGTRQWGFW